MNGRFCCNIIPDSLVHRRMDNHTVAIPLLFDCFELIVLFPFLFIGCLLFIDLLFHTMNYQYTLTDSCYKSSSILAHLDVIYFVALDSLYDLFYPCPALRWDIDQMVLVVVTRCQHIPQLTD
ncbi:hypothetical protein BDV38DRAFT_165090 [Aspergillus pseudotamarii]|uniref:Uncharacterized protein n=1 Tax=Aspergillus pseudotamarii TaxID=132259 RepID=A0A5N6SKI7_ASPPS|nr:uncharacterized protein BDV38DRAFT_165090 [Aspergillus pseudotamarii]KAE8134201.1 hypothetical protein BDV38DRAFT_165090 [Aspergillus pseudotamarii]